MVGTGEHLRGRAFSPSRETRPCRSRRYYAHLRELGFAVIELQPLGVLADPGHRWGFAPFHYTQDVYDEIVARVLEARQ